MDIACVKCKSVNLIGSLIVEYSLLNYGRLRVMKENLFLEFWLKNYIMSCRFLDFTFTAFIVYATNALL